MWGVIHSVSCSFRKIISDRSVLDLDKKKSAKFSTFLPFIFCNPRSPVRFPSTSTKHNVWTQNCPYFLRLVFIYLRAESSRPHGERPQTLASPEQTVISSRRRDKLVSPSCELRAPWGDFLYVNNGARSWTDILLRDTIGDISNTRKVTEKRGAVEEVWSGNECRIAWGNFLSGTKC